MSIPAKYDITHYQGDNYDLIVKIPVDLATAAIKFEIKTPNAASATLELTLGSGISKDTFDAGTGTTTVYVSISSAQSTTLGTTVYFYDFETTLSGQKITWFGGRFAQMSQVSE